MILITISSCVELISSMKVVLMAKIIQQMQSHSQRMENIIHDLLLLSRLEAIEDQPVNKQTLCVYSILEQLQQDALQSHQTLTIELMGDRELTLQGDEDDLKSLFSNLLFYRHGAWAVRLFVGSLKRANRDGFIILIDFLD